MMKNVIAILCLFFTYAINAQEDSKPTEGDNYTKVFDSLYCNGEYDNAINYLKKVRSDQMKQPQ